MLALAGIIGYASVSAYHRNCSARKVLSRANTYGYTNVLVIYKSHWLCPNLEATVIGFKDNYISDSTKNKLINDALNPADTIDGLMQFNSDSLMETTAFELIDGKQVDGDGTIIYKERNWVLPAIVPGGFSVLKYKRSPSTNKLEWNGSVRTWNDTQTIAPLTQPPQ
uniref:Uncharacterized protein n=1 Tax=viral metagenome TaxID=1070528 RepID=A0A6C0BVT9_9ZZZZ